MVGISPKEASDRLVIFQVMISNLSVIAIVIIIISNLPYKMKYWLEFFWWILQFLLLRVL